MNEEDFHIETTRDLSSILTTCNLVVTATPATSPLLRISDVQPGVHITAVGADTPDKQELESAILEIADIVVADSIPQCQERGEIHHALAKGIVRRDQLVELGEIINGMNKGRTSDTQITVADLTGVAVQDIRIAESVYRSIIRD
jgi:ornithine cyclodeaminase